MLSVSGYLCLYLGVGQCSAAGCEETPDNLCKVLIVSSWVTMGRGGGHEAGHEAAALLYSLLQCYYNILTTNIARRGSGPVNNGS